MDKRKEPHPADEPEQAAAPSEAATVALPEEAPEGAAASPEDAPADREKAVRKTQSEWWVKARARLHLQLKHVLRCVAAWGKANFRLSWVEAVPLLRDGLLLQNPVLVLLAGVCAALAAATTLAGAAAMGAAVTGVLLCSNLLVALLRNQLVRLAPPLRFICHMAIISAFATVADLCLRAVFPALSNQLGIFVPLVAVNGVLLSRAVHFTAERTPGYALVDGAATGVGYTAVLAVLGALREVLGSGTLGGAALFGAGFRPVSLAVEPGGGFLLLGLLMACVQWIRMRDRKGRKGDDAA